MPIIGEMLFASNDGRLKFTWREGHVMMGVGDLTAAMTALTPLALARVRLLGAGAAMSRLRVSDTAVRGDAKVLNGPSNGGKLIDNGTGKPLSTVTDFTRPQFIGDPGTGDRIDPTLPPGVPAARLPGLFCDQPWVGWLLRVEADNGYVSRRPYLLRGMPDDVIDCTAAGPSTENGVLSTSWLKLFDEFATLLVSGPYGMLSRRSNSEVKDGKPVTGWTCDAVTGLVTATIPGLNALLGQRVRLGRVRFLYVPQGVLKTYSETVKVASVVGNVYTFRGTRYGSPFYTSTLFAGGRFAGTGFARAQVAAAYPYKRFVPIGWSERDTGGSIDVPRGRKRRRARA